jgi:hypothetical protein
MQIMHSSIKGKIKLEAVMKEKETDRSSLQVVQMMIDTGTSKSETKVKGTGKRENFDIEKRQHRACKHSTKNHDYPSSSKRKDEELGENLRSNKTKRKQSLGGKAETSNNKSKH